MYIVYLVRLINVSRAHTQHGSLSQNHTSINTHTHQPHHRLVLGHKCSQCVVAPAQLIYHCSTHKLRINYVFAAHFNHRRSYIRWVQSTIMRRNSRHGSLSSPEPSFRRIQKHTNPPIHPQIETVVSLVREFNCSALSLRNTRDSNPQRLSAVLWLCHAFCLCVYVCFCFCGRRIRTLLGG